ncbi:MAG: MotA/TolQ/ExbB proton channel family protein [Verrucomicrobiota bacterium]
MAVSLREKSFVVRVLLLFAIGLMGLGGGVSFGQAPVKSMDDILGELQERLAADTRAFAALKSEIEAEQVPLARELNQLESEIVDVRSEYDQVLQTKGNRTLNLSNLKAQILAKEKQNEYLTNLLDEYVRNVETQLQVAEQQRYGEAITAGKNDALNANKSLGEKFEARMALLDLSLDRIEDAIGGAVFEGTAVDESGVVAEGRFILLGPVTYFADGDLVAGGDDTGLVRTMLNSPEPSLVDIALEEKAGVSEVSGSGAGAVPLDPTLGDAIKLAEVKTSVVTEIEKGGAVMYPLLFLAGISLLIALVKWIQLSRAQRIGPRRFGRIMEDLRQGDREEAHAKAFKVRGPIGKMLRVGIEHYDDPRDLLEELMFEHVLHTRAKLNSFIPFIKITAAAAPLLGLLGTVSGMINTFKLIMVFGTGDASTFSAGISEALITTKWGLIVAIPTLLLAAFLSRKAKAVIDDMEKVGISFMNSLPSIERKEDEAGSEPGPGGGNDGGAGGEDVRVPVLPDGGAVGERDEAESDNIVAEAGSKGGEK